MSSRLGPFATIQSKISQLQTTNGRIERNVYKMGSTAETPALHNKIEDDRQVCLRLALEIKSLLDNCPNTSQRTQLAQELQSELSRLDKLSTKLKTHDQQQITAQKNSQGQRTQNKAVEYQSQSNHHDANDDDIFTKLQVTEEQEKEDLATQLLLTEEQDQAINIANLEQRKQEIFQIEQDVQTIATMFKDLQHLVHEQGEQLDVIEENFLTTQENTEQGYAELESAEEYQIASSRNLRWVLVLGVIALIVVGIVIIVLYNKKK